MKAGTFTVVALAWMLTNDYITSPIIGISREANFYNIIGSNKVELSE